MDEPVRAILRGILVCVFSLDVERRTIPREVLILDASQWGKVGARVHDDAEFRLATCGVRIGEGVIEGVGSTLDGLILGLERHYRIPILKNVDMPGRYDFKIVWDPENENSLAQALQDTLAITMTKDNRAIEVLVVEQKARNGDTAECH